MLKRLLKILKIINSNTHPGLIAHAVSVGLLLGFLPKNNVFWYIITVFFLFVRINKPTFAVSTLLFSLLAPLLDSTFDIIGYWFLTLPKLAPFFSKLLDIPFVAFTRFNNTVVMGALLFGLALYIPVYWFMRLFVRLWRRSFAPLLRNSKLVKFLSKLPLIKKIGEAYVAAE